MTHDVTPDVYISGRAYESVDTVLRRRGHLVAAGGDVRQTLFPQERLADIMNAFRQSVEYERYAEVFDPHAWRRYLELMGRASFRKVLRKLIDSGGKLVAIQSLAEIAGRRAGEYVAYLEALQVVERVDEHVRLIRQVDSFGPSFEHYVMLLFQWELRGSAGWGVKVEGLPRAGGDFDVLAWLPPNLVYVECKAGDPRNIEEMSIRHFLQRTEELSPELAIYLVDTDTDLALDDPTRLGLVSRFNRIICDTQHRDERADQRPLKPQMAYPGVTWGFRRIYVTNSSPSVLTQLRRCLQLYHRTVKDLAFFSDEEPLDFLEARPSS